MRARSQADHEPGAASSTILRSRAVAGSTHSSLRQVRLSQCVVGLYMQDGCELNAQLHAICLDFPADLAAILRGKGILKSKRNMVGYSV